MGVFEWENFRDGSDSILKSLMDATKRGAKTIVGGGDSVSFVKMNPGAAESISHVSTGGGASLELLEGKTLPGIDDLTSTGEFYEEWFLRKYISN